MLACHELGYQIDLTAVNHWPVAVQTHTANHGTATHFCEDLGAIDPLKAVPGGHLHLLVASPECTHHSNARGGKPMQDQSRASAWHVTRWAGVLQIDNLLIENVPEFRHWGPLGENGRPLKSRRGETFRAFLHVLRSMNYRVEWRVLNAADFGDATTRKRLFVIARRGSRKVHWPEPTHAPQEDTDLLGTRQRWRAAREIIDWTIPGKSIFARKKPLSANTMRRIIAGLKRFGGPELDPFIVMLNGTTAKQTEASNRAVSDPLPTVTAATHLYLAEPFLIGQQTDAMPRSVSQPVPTVAASGAIALVQPFVLSPEGIHRGNVPRSINQPLATITAGRGGGHIVEAFVVGAGGAEFAGQPASVTKPLGAVLTKDSRALVQPFLVPVTHAGGEERCHSANAPLPTITGAHRGETALIEAFVVQTDQTGGGAGCVRSVDDPLITVVSKQNAAVCVPHLTKFYGTGAPQSVEEPLDTVTAKDRFGLVQPMIRTADGQTFALDIHFRMLQPHELAGAMGFPADYQFTGNREERVKQIGNAVPVNLSKALIRALLESEVRP